MMPRTEDQRRELLALGQAVRELRAERNMSASELAAACGLSPRRIASLKAGRVDPNYDGLVALTRGLGVKASELLGRADDNAKAGDA
jgi:transcriptional regulator with XRE-family HTH domain